MQAIIYLWTELNHKWYSAKLESVAGSRAQSEHNQVNMNECIGLALQLIIIFII